MTQQVVDISTRLKLDSYREDLNDEPKTIGDLVQNFHQLLINYGRLLDDMLTAHEDEASENGSENPEAIESLVKMREKLVDVRQFLLQLKEVHDKHIKEYKDVMDEEFDLDIENDSETEAFAVAQIKLTVKKKKFVDHRGVFQRAAWPTDKEEKVPTFVLMEAQRRLRKTKTFLWGAEDDII